MRSPTPAFARRHRVIAAMMTLPALLTTLLMLSVEGWRLLRPQSELFEAPFVYSLADAIQQNQVDQAFSFIRAGQDPNQPIAVSDPALTAGRRMLISPLMWAVATQRREALQMLLGFGARLDPVTASDALCLAEALGDEEIAAILIRHGARLDERCADRRLGNAPLVALAINSGSAPPAATHPPR
jgi:hypothetical protein